jgi:hypothetical protein
MALRARPVARDTALIPKAPRRQRLSRREPSPTPLIEHRTERREPQTDGRFVNHQRTI